MISILLFVFGVLGLILDLKRGKRGFDALIWNNFKYYFCFSLMFLLTINLVILIYQLENITSVLTKITTNYGLYGEVSLFFIFSVPIILIILVLLRIMFLEVKYKEIKKIRGIDK